MDICLICSQNKYALTDIIKSNNSENLILNKLKKVIPELDWSFDFSICNTCINNLNAAYEFKQLCTNSYLSIKHNKDVDHQALDCEFDPEGLESTEIFETDCEENLEEHIYKKDIPLNINEIVGDKNKDLAKNSDDSSSDTSQKSKQPTNILPACELCLTTFKNNYLLKRHRQNVHATEKKFTCDICNKNFVSSVYLNAHKQYHSGTRPHICSFCGKSFITASDLYHHEKIHANKRAYQCEICPKAFNTSSDLHKHKICVHTDRKDWKYICQYCKKRFPLKVNLESHIKTHTGEKNFSCHLCERKCINKSILMRHIETHTNAISFRCDICVRGYKHKKSLNEHKAKVHKLGEVNLALKTKKFECYLCPKSYYANNKLEKHVRSHNGEKPFKCPHCHRCFSDKSYIKQHLKLIHNRDDKL